MVLRLAGFLVFCLGIMLVGASIAAWPAGPHLTVGLLAAGVGLCVWVKLFDEEGT